MEAIEVSIEEPINGRDFYRVYYLNDYIMYESHFQFDSSTKQYIYDSLSNEMTQENNLLLSETRTNYFVFHKDSSFGINYTPGQLSTNEKRLDVTNTLKNIELQSNGLEAILYKRPDSAFWSKDKMELKEVYLEKLNDSLPLIHRKFYYSKRLVGLKVSFSEKIDNAKSLKLYKIEGVMEQFFDKNTGKLFPSSKAVSEMKQILLSTEDQKKAIQYFKAYNALMNNVR